MIESLVYVTIIQKFLCSEMINPKINNEKNAIVNKIILKSNYVYFL